MSMNVPRGTLSTPPGTKNYGRKTEKDTDGTVHWCAEKIALKRTARKLYACGLPGGLFGID
jgi:hypothetical protein